jgi:hypothetical protein
MTPTHFTIKNDTTFFHYKTSELRRFVSQGLQDGNVGTILIKRNGNMLTYKGFGTIENPIRNMINITFCHHPLFDGKMLTDEERCNPPSHIFNKMTSSFIVFDVSKFSDDELLKKQNQCFTRNVICDCNCKCDGCGKMYYESNIKIDFGQFNVCDNCKQNPKIQFE